MVRLYMFVEGKTEQTFASNVLRPHLARYEVCLQGAVEIAHARKKGIVHRGGAIRYQPMKDDIRCFLKQEKSPEVFFTTMVDLYKVMNDFPGIDDSEQHRNNPRQRIEFLEAAFANDINDQRFIPPLQLHEFEALLFADIECLNSLLENRQKQVDELARMCAEFETPELINDGPQTAPSKRIIQHLPEYKNLKTTLGPLATEHLGLTKLRDRCPHFSEWVRKLEALGAAVKL